MKRVIKGHYSNLYLELYILPPPKIILLYIIKFYKFLRYTSLPKYLSNIISYIVNKYYNKLITSLLIIYL
jgi:hypothetical protein